MAGNTRLQELGKLTTIMEGQDRILTELKARHSNTNGRIDQLVEMISGLTLQQTQLMSQLQGGKIDNLADSIASFLLMLNNIATRIGKLEFPKFNGEEVENWLYRCEQFFEVDRTLEELKLKLVVIHLEGRALQWHQSYMKSLAVEGKNVSWKDYIMAIVLRFDDTGYEDPMTDLKSLRQYGSLKDYMNEFDTILNKVNISEADALSHFLGGLNAEIQLPVRMFKPSTLAQAYSLARLQESTYSAMSTPGSFTQKLQGLFSQYSQFRANSFVVAVPKTMGIAANQTKSPSTMLSKPGGNGLLPLPATTPYKHPQGGPQMTRPLRKLTSKELEEKRSKNLCFWCDERFTSGHKCSRRQSFMIEVEVLTEGQEEVIQEEDIANDEALHLISVHALAGTRSFQTMRVMGVVDKKPLHILVDSGSTHNFLNENVRNKVGWPAESITPVKVSVVNGHELLCDKMCREFQWRMQGQDYRADMFLLALDSYDMVLGVQWLSTLGGIIWNFKELQMKFQVRGKEKMLKGDRKEDLKTVNEAQMDKLLQ
ncbi:hypothetical protein CRG98_011630 [Punica granatum]|uniref:Retrotransposon gag domain-containing protein n=1 Tax=Punica granatum TaxID=22663 RepID=A0A2I0KHP9_PUNGR|nr:hypothetical protein CRG98_011630 [Punica granatum]